MLFLWWVKVAEKLSSLDSEDQKEHSSLAISRLFVILVVEFGCEMQWIPILGRSPQNLRRLLQILEVEEFGLISEVNITSELRLAIFISRLRRALALL